MSFENSDLQRINELLVEDKPGQALDYIINMGARYKSIKDDLDYNLGYDEGYEDGREAGSVSSYGHGYELGRFMGSLGGLYC